MSRASQDNRYEYMSLSAHQFFMLKHFAIGWKFKLYNDRPGSWVTYWSLRRRGLVDSGSVVTELGYKVLANDMKLQEKRKAKNDRRKRKPHQADQGTATGSI